MAATLCATVAAVALTTFATQLSAAFAPDTRPSVTLRSDPPKVPSLPLKADCATCAFLNPPLRRPSAPTAPPAALPMPPMADTMLEPVFAILPAARNAARPAATYFNCPPKGARNVSIFPNQVTSAVSVGMRDSAIAIWRPR